MASRNCAVLLAARSRLPSLEVLKLANKIGMRTHLNRLALKHPGKAVHHFYFDRRGEVQSLDTMFGQFFAQHLNQRISLSGRIAQDLRFGILGDHARRFIDLFFPARTMEAIDLDELRILADSAQNRNRRVISELRPVHADKKGRSRLFVEIADKTIVDRFRAKDASGLVEKFRLVLHAKRSLGDESSLHFKEVRRDMRRFR